MNTLNTSRVNIVKKSFGVASSVLLLALTQTRAATYYVSTSGDDANSGASSAPFRTITHAYSLASPGTTIIVEPGTYTDYQSGWGLHLSKSGTASSPIVLKSQVPLQAVIDGQFASDRNKDIYLDGSYNIINGFDITRAPNTGIYIEGSNNQILDNNIYNNGTQGATDPEGQGIFSNEGTSGNVYERNYIHDNGFPGSHLDHGMYLCGNNELVVNNVVIRQPSRGLQIAGYTTVSNMKVYNNVFAWNGIDGITAWQAMNGVEIKNNIIFHNGRDGVEFYAATGSGVTIDNNVIYGNGSANYSFIDGGSTCSYSVGTTISSDPKLVNETQSGFDGHLAAGSPAISAGINMYSLFTDDIAGLQREATGAWEIGAHIYGTSNVASTPTTVPCAISRSITITWNSTAGKTYYVAYKNSLSDPAWTTLSGTITASGSTTTYTDTAIGAEPSRFYCIWVTN